MFAVDGAGRVLASALSGDGSGITGVNADLLDGQDSSSYALSGHTHSGSDVTAGTVAEARIDAALSRDAEVLPIVLAGDGPGSGLDADLLDGQEAAAFAGASHDHAGWIVATYRVQVFGHAAHTLFTIQPNQPYVGVPGTSAQGDSQRFPAPPPGAVRTYRIEVTFATFHDLLITLRMNDPFNTGTIIPWEHSFRGGHASKEWWSWGTSPRFTTPFFPQVWNRQHQLEVKLEDPQSNVRVGYLGAVWIVAEDTVP